jgi:hypothetical protein
MDSFKPIWWSVGTSDIADDVVVVVQLLTDVDVTTNFTPSIADVGRLLRARTKDDKMREVGTFTSSTRPTNTDAADLIEQGTSDVASAAGGTIPDTLISDARSVSALRSAMLIELSYWPEQINNQMSAYQKYKDLYDESLARLVKAVEGEVPGDGGGGGTDPQGNPIPMPSFSYPDDPGIGLGTQW